MGGGRWCSAAVCRSTLGATLRPPTHPPVCPPSGPHRPCSAQTAQILFTDLELGASRRAFYSGGPGGAGPASGAWTTFWNIRG